jgi:4-diphosphocytidyl-2-C-methyl-D-erythritol kinase
MSGSGATCFALFETLEFAKGAARQLRDERPDWWIAAAALATGEADFSAVSESPA